MLDVGSLNQDQNFRFELFPVMQKKSPATPAAEYKKTDEAQPDVKEEEVEEEEEEEEEEEKAEKSPGLYGVSILIDDFLSVSVV